MQRARRSTPYLYIVLVMLHTVLPWTGSWNEYSDVLGYPFLWRILRRGAFDRLRW